MLILEGGAGGHMRHPFDLDDVLTGKDLVKKFYQIAEEIKTGNLPDTKIDGVNTSIKVVDGPNGKEFAMDRGSAQPLDVQGITLDKLGQKFSEGHGMIGAGKTVLGIFNDALPTITSELKKLGLYDDPSKFFNMEYVKGTTNVLSYDHDFVKIHGVNQFYEKSIKGTPVRPGLERPLDPETGKSIKDPSTPVDYDKTVMESMVQKLNEYSQKYGFKVYSAIPSKAVKDFDFSRVGGVEIPVTYSQNQVDAKTLGQRLQVAQNRIGEKVLLKTGKKIPAQGKEIYKAVLGTSAVDKNADPSRQTPLDQLLANKEDYQKAIDGAVFWHATRLLGNVIIDAMEVDHPAVHGPASEHEGMVIILKGDNFATKITGEFILGGEASTFRKEEPEAKEPLIQRINQADVVPTLQWLENIIDVPLTGNMIGTTGKKATSGNLDIAVDETQYSKQDIMSSLAAWVSQNVPDAKVTDYIQKSGITLHFKTPIKGDSANGYVETDFIFGDPEFMIWSSQGEPEGKITGQHRQILINSIASAKGYAWSGFAGLINRATKEKTVEPVEITRILLGDGHSPDELASFPKILNAIKDNPDYEKLVAMARDTLPKFGLTLPERSNQITEEYVVANPSGDIKLVDRAGFAAANRPVQREGLNYLNEELNEFTIALFPGSFKPPHRGHMAVVEQLADSYDNVLVIVSAPVKSVRSDISAEQAAEIFNLYIQDAGLSSKARAIASSLPTPLGAAYKIIEEENFVPNTKIFIATSSKDAGRFPQKSLDKAAQKNPTHPTANAVEVQAIAGDAGIPISASQMREVIKSGQFSELRKFMPDYVSKATYNKVISILSGEPTEMTLNEIFILINEMSAIASGSVEGYNSNAERRKKFRKKGTHNKMNAEEKQLREVIRNAIRVNNLNKNKEYNKNKLEEQQLRFILRKLILEVGDEQPIHDNTGINILEDLLKKIIPVIQTDYKIMTTSEIQRKSFRAHILNAIQNSLKPDLYRKETLHEKKNIKIDIENPEELDHSKFIDVFDTKGKKAKEEEDAKTPEARLGAGLEKHGLDSTGRNMALQTFRKVDNSIMDAYIILDDEQDKELFYDYLITNLKLYFDKFEEEMVDMPKSEPTSPQYDKEKADKAAEDEAI